MHGETTLFAEYGPDRAHRREYRAAQLEAQGSLFEEAGAGEAGPTACTVCAGEHDGPCPHGEALTLEVEDMYGRTLGTLDVEAAGHGCAGQLVRGERVATPLTHVQRSYETSRRTLEVRRYIREGER